MLPIHELPIDELWQFVSVQFDKHDGLWDLLRLDVARFLELQRLARATGKIPKGSAWEPVSPDEAAGIRADLDDREALWIRDRPIRDQWIRDHPDALDEAAWIREHRDEAATGPRKTRGAVQGPLWRRRPGDRGVLVRAGEVIVELPLSGRELKAAGPPRRRAGRPPKLTDEVLRQHLVDHPDLSHAQRALSLHALGLTDTLLRRDTIASRVRALKKRPKKAP